MCVYGHVCVRMYMFVGLRTWLFVNVSICVCVHVSYGGCSYLRILLYIGAELHGCGTVGHLALCGIKLYNLHTEGTTFCGVAVPSERPTMFS